MGTTLTGTTPQDTYDSLIKVTDNGPLSGTAKYLSDGLGNDSALSLSTSAVGVGTISNSYTAAGRGNLNIAGSGGAILGFQIGGAPKGYVFHDNTNLQLWNEVAGNLLFGTNAAERMRITSTGNVGIGTSSPITKFSVVDGTNSYAATFDGAGGTSLVAIGTTGGGPSIAGYTAGFAASTNLLLNPDGGNVGIGTDAPTALLDVRAAGSAVGSIKLSSAVNTNGAAYVAQNAGGTSYFGRNSSTGGAFTGAAYATVVYGGGAYPMSFYTNDTEQMRITSAGNVGIGLTNPSQKLEVQNAAAGAAIRASNSGGGYAQLAVSSNATSVAELSFTNSLSLTGGNVGIGTSSPSSPLTVYKATSPDVDIQNSSALHRITGDSGSLLIRADYGNTAANTHIQFSLDGTEVSRFTPNGLTFNGDTAAANALDDYEEGTWTGTLKGGTTDPTTPVTATGRYTKIGRVVTAEIQIDNANTAGASGSVSVTGLPFASLTEAQGAVMCDLYNFAASCTSVNCYVSPFGTTLNFFTSGSGVGWSPLSHNAGTGRSLRGTITYFV